MVDVSPDRETTSADRATLERRIAELEQELGAECHGRLRALADFDNYRRRIDREAGSARRRARAMRFVPSWTSWTTWSAR